MVNSAIYQLNVISEIYWKKTDLADLDSQFLKHLLRAHLIPEIRATITCLLQIEFSHHLSKVSMENFELLNNIFCLYYVQGGQSE